MTTDIYMLVSGIEFGAERPFFASRKSNQVRVTDFRVLAHSRLKQLEKLPGKKEFILIDVLRGEIRVTDSSKDLKGSLQFVSKIFDRADQRKHYHEVYLDGEVRESVHVPELSGTPRLIGAADIYDQIMDIGRKQPGRLKEVSFFGHGFSDGPVLVNTYKGLRVTGEHEKVKVGNKYVLYPKARTIDLLGHSDLRDGLDKDLRPEDFDPDLRARRNIGDGPSYGHFARDELETFNKAFHPESLWWVWGCNADSALQSILRQLIAKGMLKKDLAPETVLELRLSGKENIQSFANTCDTNFKDFPDITKLKGSQLKFRATVAECKSMMKIYLQETFAFKVLHRITPRLIAAAPGTWSTYHPVTKKSAWFPPSQRPINRLFMKYFNVAEDHENRGYMDYSGLRYPRITIERIL
ncbi:MAG: hypothetical protein HKN15_07605 [Xanthomonadales bacterium]|nr:hypothetical protein [Xanthomonadales bacterium]